MVPPRRLCCALSCALLVCASAGGLVACKGRSRGDRIQRTSDAAPVQVVTPGDPATRARADVAEREPNDEPSAANELAWEASGRGRIESPKDVDRYRVVVAKPGALTALLSAVPQVDGVLELRAVRDDAVLVRSDRGGANIDEGVAGYWLDAGSYDLIVRAFVKPPSKSRKSAPASAPVSAPAGFPSQEYELSVSLAEPAEGAEHEPNFDGGTASALAIGEPGVGVIGWAQDVDVWKIGTEVLSDSDALDLELSSVDSLALTLEVRDGLGRTLIARKASKGQPVAVRGFVAPAGAPPFSYVAVSGDRSNPTRQYQLVAKVRELATGDEREVNDRLEIAQELGEEGAPQRAVLDAGDVDCFALSAAAQPRRVEVVVDPGAPPPAATTSSLALEVLLGSKVVATSDERAGKVERAVFEVPAGQRAVLRVRSTGKGGEPGQYQLTWAQVGEDAMPPEEGANGEPEGSSR